MFFFSPDCPFKGPGSLPKFLDSTPSCIIQNAVARYASMLPNAVERFDSHSLMQESDFNSNNSTNMKPNNQIWNQLRIWTMVLGGYFWWKKNGGGKSCATVPLTTKYIKSFQRSFDIGSIIVFSFEGIRSSVYTNLYGILRNWTVKKFRGIMQNYAELREIKSLPYSAEFQNGTSENTLLPVCHW